AVAAVAVAPEGGTLTRVELVVRGAATFSRSVEVRGAEAHVDAALTIPSGGRLGADRVPAELVVLAYAAIDGRERVSAPVVVPLTVVDRTRPELDVSIAPIASGPALGFDRLLPAQSPFTITVVARDPVGGVRELRIDAPAALGGPRVRTFAPTAEARFEAAFETPENGDLELVVSATDAALEPNVTEQILRIRVGEGGVDRLIPAITFLTPAHAECGEETGVTALATDDSAGLERLTLRGPGVEVTSFGPDPRNPLTLLATATVAAPRDAVGATLELTAEARDLAGNTSVPRTLSLPIEDTRAPFLAAVLGADLAIAPGGTWSANVDGSDACGVVADVITSFTDASGARARVAVPIAAPRVARRITFDVPAGLCALGTLTATVALADGGGRVSPAITVRAPGLDRIAPLAHVQLLAPASGLTPGERIELEGHTTDLETPIRSATVTVTAQGLAIDGPLAVAHEHFAAALCAERGERVIPTSVSVPPDVRFTAPAGALVVEVSAEDASGNAVSSAVSIPVVDRAAPEVELVGISDGAIVGLGDTVSVEVEARDLGHDVADVALSVLGPAWIGAGAASATVAIGAASGRATFSVTIDPAAPLGAPITLVATARDTSAVPVTGRAVRTLETCSAPSLAAVSP
ncbi:hypothetical protein L6R52_43785, partial [Myxococcota bacterium]|nr:hypothetical protein [Myxococcota bacterium]